MPNYYQIDPVLFEEKIFEVFLLVAKATRILHGIEIFEQM